MLLRMLLVKRTSMAALDSSKVHMGSEVAEGFVADTILGGFDLNQPAVEYAPEGYVAPPQSAAGTFGQKFATRAESAASSNASFVDEEGGEEICSQPLVPYVGMTFDDLEVAKQVYNDYAFKLGFGTRIGNTKYSIARGAPKDAILSRLFECVHAGKPVDEAKNATKDSSGEGGPIDMSNFSAQKSRSKQAGLKMDVADLRQKNRVLRHDCKARMLVGKRNGIWTVTVFQGEHTHQLLKQIGRRRYYRSHRKVTEEDFQFIQTLHNQNINTTQIMGCLGSVHGGDPMCLGFVKRDVSNIRTMLREEVSLRDMSMTIEYFERRQAESPTFFFDKQVDENNAVRALFWVDGRTRALYPKYKDSVFFDTTFCTNKYNMPFAPLVGINNHTQTIMLGCALLPDETTDTFSWVFTKLKEAMNGLAPEHIMTDQYQAMAAAISNIYPDSVHRCCIFHVLRLARTKLGPHLREGSPFAAAFYSCIYSTDTVAEYEICWQHMLETFAMAENTHLQNMWKSRKMWAHVYFRQCFFPFTSTTGRSEGLNSYFKTLVRPSGSVWNFVQQYELCQNLMLDREDNAAFTMDTTTAPLWGSYNIEKQGLEFYTREIFTRFQKMIEKSTRFYPMQVEGEGMCFDLIPNPGYGVKTYQVQVKLDDECYKCGCNTFEMCGLICPHIVRVMVHLNVQQIPERYMLRRWSAAATMPAPDPGTNTIRFGIPGTNTLRYNALCRKMNELASDACFTDETYVAVSKMIDDAKRLVANMRNTRHATHEQEVEQQGGGPEILLQEQSIPPQHGVNNQRQEEEHNDAPSSTLKNPERVKPKGRPTEKSKRNKPLVELRDEANAKRRKKAQETKKKQTDATPKKKKPRKQKCPYCNEEGHTVKQCVSMEALIAGNAAKIELKL